MVRAVILAAGASTRMGTPKATLRVARTAETFLSQLIHRFADAGLPDIVVVTGAHEAAVRRAAGRTRLPIRFAHNEGWADGQLTSLLTGLEDRPGERLEAAMIALVDTPFVTADTIRRVLHAWRTTGAPIVRPAQGDTHGHPVLFDRTVFPALRAADPQHGAKPVVHSYADRVVNVPVEDEGAFVDVDTPEDYERRTKN
jgi:molybdenum cofactor cytidylyltransferase